MFIQNQTANHQLCWSGAISIRLPQSALTEVTNPLIALDILKNHWDGQPYDQKYELAVEACLRAMRGQGELSAARTAFRDATEHLAVKETGDKKRPSDIRADGKSSAHAGKQVL